MSFWSSIFTGQNKTLNSNIDKFGSIGGFATGLGEKSVGQAAKFASDIVSGDPSKIAKSLGPEIGTIQTQQQQNKNQTAQFSNRSGGNNASLQMAGDTTRGAINNLVSSLLGKSVDTLANIGTAEQGIGADALKTQTDMSQIRMKNWEDSIFGRGATSAAAAGESFLLGKL